MFQGTRFCVQLFVRDRVDVSKFRVNAPLGELDILFNPVSTSSQLLRGELPWRGAREKSDDLMKSVIESLTSTGDIVLDWNASTGEHFTPYFSKLKFIILNFFSYLSILCHRFMFCRTYYSCLSVSWQTHSGF